MLEFPVPKPLPVWVEETLANPEPPWLIPGFIPAQGLVIVAGRPKIAKKSWFAYLAAMSMASGRAVGPFTPSGQVNVLFYSREGPAGPIAHRFKAIEAGMGLSVAECGGLYWVHHGGVFLDEPAHIKRICEYVHELNIGCVVFDTFARSFRGDENNARDVGAAMRGVEKIRDAGAATLLVHHLGKSKIATIGGEPDPDAGLRGSSALAGAYDNIISIQELEVEGDKEVWAIVGGKFMDFHGYLQEWDIKGDIDGNPISAKLTFKGPQELPTIEEPRQRLGGR